MVDSGEEEDNTPYWVIVTRGDGFEVRLLSGFYPSKPMVFDTKREAQDYLNLLLQKGKP